MIWGGVPRPLTISREECERRYKVQRQDQYVRSCTDIEYGPEIWCERGEVKIIRGCRDYIMYRHRWNNSATNGGYIEVVIRRYLKRKYNNDFSQFKNPWDIGVGKLVREMSKKHYCDSRTGSAVEHHIVNGIKNKRMLADYDAGIIY